MQFTALSCALRTKMLPMLLNCWISRGWNSATSDTAPTAKAIQACRSIESAYTKVGAIDGTTVYPT
jgi:hypothetical protein